MPRRSTAPSGRSHSYAKLTTELPPVYRRLVAGERLRIGEREFEILTGGGHAPEQVMLLNRAEKIFFAADQVLARISPNIGVWPWEPLADPLGDYLRSLADLRREVPDDVLALPAHNLPFHGLHRRLAALERHHALRCAEIVAACADAPRTVAEVLPVLFPRALDAHQTGFAFGEVLAHVNYMVRRRGTRGRHRPRRECSGMRRRAAALNASYPSEVAMPRNACSANARIELVRTLPVLPSISVNRAATASSGAS